MLEQMREARSHVGVAGEHPPFIDAGTAPDDAFCAIADEHPRRALAANSGASSAIGVSTVIARVADRLASAGFVDCDTENQTAEAAQTIPY
ncbi:MAG: hypothetical protein ACOCUO_01405 [archaeon]